MIQGKPLGALSAFAWAEKPDVLYWLQDDLLVPKSDQLPEKTLVAAIVLLQDELTVKRKGRKQAKLMDSVPARTTPRD